VPDETMKGENGKKDLIGFKDYLKDPTIDAYDTAFDSKLGPAEPIGTSKDKAGPLLDNYMNNHVSLQNTQIVQDYYFKFTTVSDDGWSTVSHHFLLYVVAIAITMKVLA